ncbi:MAG: FadR family transcriptional regulator [Spirochaetes bacterium]|nr:FadR family transcriptional regulator [Spirochaetota bacterium]
MKEEIYKIDLKGKKDLPNLLADHFISLISLNILIPGEKLPSELALSRKLNISRIAMRESMKILEAKGFINSLGRKGKFVKTILQANMVNTFQDMLLSNRENIKKLFDVKTILDREIAVHVCNNADESDMKNMYSYICSLDTDDLPRLRNCYYNFFNAFFSSSKNVFFSHLAIQISNSIKEYFEIHSTEKIDSMLTEKTVFSQMKNIYTEVTNRNVSGSRENIDIHNNYVKNIFIK